MYFMFPSVLTFSSPCVCVNPKLGVSCRLNKLSEHNTRCEINCLEYRVKYNKLIHLPVGGVYSRHNDRKNNI